MKSLKHARQRARECRDALGASPDGLPERVRRYLFDTHGIELHRANEVFLEGGRAEVSPAEGCLFYDERLDDDPAEKLVVVLHEWGHLELHARLKRCCATPDPVYGSMYLDEGAPALARYNRRAREEAEANAFATEFLYPSREVLQQWRENPHENSARMARRLGVPVSIVQAQLAEALYWLAVGEDLAPRDKDARALEYEPSQLEAATCTGRPVLVHAGPGTGKTATLVRRMAYLLEEGGAEPEHLLVLTFSNHAAEELQDRIAAQFGAGPVARIKVSTFHGFGVSFLHHHGHFLHLDGNASVLDNAGQEELVTRLLGTVLCAKLVTLHDPDATVKAIVRHIGYRKDRLCTPEDFAAALAAWHPAADEQPQHEAADEFLDVYRAYEAAKMAQQYVDFADLIALPISILDESPTLLSAYRDKYAWVMVDEYQDVSRAVASLLRRLCGPGNPPWVVGDTRQAIYRFRGAAPENVDQFEHDFPGARVFHLDTNYRSCAEIVGAANQLAMLMEMPEREGSIAAERWKRGAEVTTLGEPAVAIARADSDQAEYEGIAAQVETWLSMGIAARDIAVLARRNIDVKDIALALGKRGIQATTSRLVTPEGAAGDLAAIATLTDQPRASLPRLTFALGRGRFTVQVMNAVITRVLATLDGEGRFAVDGYDGNGGALAAAMRHVSERLHAARFTGDAFTMRCTFLFDSSEYLRRLLDRPTGAEQALALNEIVTSLSRAAGYRFLHPDVEPRASRKGFAQYFRASLCSSAPSLIPPQSSVDAVRVMTCHAAKGLEFPCVIVAGQTLSQAARRYAWLPPALTPPVQDDIEQADALFFVGVTRAQRALVVTYATSAGGATRSRVRDVTPLLSRWHTVHAVHTRDVPSHPPMRTQIAIGAIWGGAPSAELAARALDQNACSIRTYLEHYCRVRFPLNVRPLYPIFFDAVRRVMGRIVRQVQAREANVSGAEARDVFWHEWSSSEVTDHPHQALYVNLACDYIEQFAQAYTPHPAACIHVDLTATDGDTGLVLRHDLLAHYHADDGTTVAMTWRPESLAEKSRANGLLWSGLSSAHRVSFVMLKQSAAHLQPYVFSAADGVLYPYAWTTNAKASDKEAERITLQLHAFEQRIFDTTVREWTCDRCPVRVSCPYWIGALGDAPDSTEELCL